MTRVQLAARAVMRAARDERYAREQYLKSIGPTIGGSLFLWEKWNSAVQAKAERERRLTLEHRAADKPY